MVQAACLQARVLAVHPQPVAAISALPQGEPPGTVSAAVSAQEAASAVVEQAEGAPTNLGHTNLQPPQQAAEPAKRASPEAPAPPHAGPDARNHLSVSASGKLAPIAMVI